jgi:hypothetical protein
MQKVYYLVVTLREAYLYIFGLLNGLYWAKPGGNLGQILGDMTLWHPFSWYGSPADPAYSGDWEKAVRKVTTDDNLDDLQAQEAAVHLLTLYDSQGINLKREIKFLQNIIDKEVEARKSWRRLQPKA